MIYVLCSGGLGNQMFQYAYLKHLQKTGREAVLDTSFFLHSDIHSGYMLNKAFNIEGNNVKDHFSFIWKSKYSMMAKSRMKELGSVFMEFGENFIREDNLPTSAVLYGYWQGERFFKDVRKDVIKDFTFRNISEQSEKLGEKMSIENSVAVHIRRGDYLLHSKYMNLAATQYYKNALGIAKKELIETRIYVFSDDISWCKQCGLFDDETCYVDFNNGAHAYEDMFLMSKAKAVITANSSFSWWAGYLGNHEFVIRPEKYLTNWTNEQDTRLFPGGWIVGKIGD